MKLKGKIPVIMLIERDVPPRESAASAGGKLTFMISVTVAVRKCSALKHIFKKTKQNMGWIKI